MLEHHLFIILKGRLRADAIIAGEGVATSNIFSQHQGRLFGREFLGGEDFRPAPPHQSCLACCLQVAYPIHNTIWGDQVALTIALKRHYRDTSRQTALASSHREYVHRILRFPEAVYLEACAKHRHSQNVCCSHKKRDLRFFCHLLPLISMSNKYITIMISTRDAHK